MSKSTRIKAGLATVVAAAAMAMAVVSASANEPGETVTLKSTITINPYGYNAGKVTAVERELRRGAQGRPQAEGGTGQDRAATTDVHQGFAGTLTAPSGAATTRAEASSGQRSRFKVYAEVKPVTQGTAGTIYKCLGATSKTITINGG